MHPVSEQGGIIETLHLVKEEKERRSPEARAKELKFKEWRVLLLSYLLLCCAVVYVLLFHPPPMHLLFKAPRVLSQSAVARLDLATSD